MQDSEVKITVSAVDEASSVFQKVGAAAVAGANTSADAWNKTSGALKEATTVTNEAATSTENAARATDDHAAAARRSYFAQTALTTVLSAGINKAFLTMIDVTGQAIKRVDLLSQFPASMQALGLSATDASQSLQTLANYVGQVGGNLGDATTSVTRFAEVTKNVKAATAEFVGVNNALIAGGAGADVQKNALEQLTQAYARGKPQLIEWRSMMVAMPAQLNQVAQAMGYVNAGALGDALTHGTVSMQDFMTQLTKMSTGTGPIVNQMYARMNGIQFAFNVFKNALVTGMTEIINAVGRSNIIAFFNLLTGAVQQLAVWGVQLISILMSVFNFISRIFGGPQLAMAKDQTAGVAGNLGDAAANADGLANGLGKAGKAAKSAAAAVGQLAAFDKMNVLKSPSSGSGSGSGSGAGAGGAGVPAGITPADASALNGIFDGIGGKIAKITTAAKILAAVIASLAGVKFAQALLNQFNGLISTIEQTSKNIGKLTDKLNGKGSSSNVFTRAKSSAADLVSSLQDLGVAIADIFAGSKIGGAIISFIKLISSPFARLGGIVAEGLGIAGAVALGILGGIGETVAAVFIGAAAAATLPLDAVIAIGVAVVAAVIGAIVLIWVNWNTIWGWIKKVAQDFWNWFLGLWNGLVNFFKPLWAGVMVVFTDVQNFLKKWGVTILEILLSPFIFAVAAIVLVVTTLVGFFQFIWSGISLIFSVVGDWFKARFTEAWNNIVAIWTVVSQWFDDNVWKPLVQLFTPIVDWFKVRFSLAWEAIMLVWNPVVKWFSGVWNGIMSIFAAVGGWFGDRFNEAWGAITRIFGGLFNWFLNNVWNPIVGLFTNVGTTIGNAIGRAFRTVVNVIVNGAVTIINGFIDALNNAIHIINKIPGVNIPPANRLPVPQLATGGIIDSPTLAMVGEAGTEAVMPLENNTEWIDKLAAKINASGKNNGQPIQLTVQIGEDKIVSKVIDLINERTQMSGRNTILV